MFQQITTVQTMRQRANVLWWCHQHHSRWDVWPVMCRQWYFPKYMLLLCKSREQKYNEYLSVKILVVDMFQSWSCVYSSCGKMVFWNNCLLGGKWQWRFTGCIKMFQPSEMGIRMCWQTLIFLLLCLFVQGQICSFNQSHTPFMV